MEFTGNETFTIELTAEEFGKKGPLYFAEYDGKLVHTVDSLETKKFISLFKIELKEG